MEALQPADWSRLRSYARFRVAGLPAAQLKARTAMDLLGEAITRTATGERRWRREVTFVRFLLEAMRSISTAWRHEANPDLAEAVDDLSEQVDLKKIVESPEGARRAEPSPYEFTLAREHLAAIREHFNEDAEVLLIIAGLGEGREVAEIATILDLAPKTFEAALKRLRRHVRSLFPDWRPR